VVKLYAAGLLPASYALGKLGYSDDEVAEIRAARALDTTAPATGAGAVLSNSQFTGNLPA